MNVLHSLQRLIPVVSVAMIVPAHAETHKTATVDVVLIGASIGQDWNLAGLPERTGQTRISLEALQIWQFDKSEAVNEVLQRPKRPFNLSLGYVKSLLKDPPRPAQVVLIKECSAYFPGDTALPRKQALVDQWVRQIRERKVAPMLATVVPVTAERSHRDPGKQEALRVFNDWLRNYAKHQAIPLVDLEAALRADNQDRFLRDDLTSGDGSHLNSKAYGILDRLLIETLCSGVAAGSCSRHPPVAR